MYRAALRPASRPALNSLRSTLARASPRRLASTSTATPAEKPRSWKSLAARWGLAVAAVYYYNVNSAFADDLSSSTLAQTMQPEAETHTVESLVEQRRLHNASKKPLEKTIERAAETTTKTLEDKTQSDSPAETSQDGDEAATSATSATTGPAALGEEAAGQDGAFNPETGEINWDCPCLGGMAHGPCGEDFKTAFSCFVYSTEEPKGMDCVDKFQAMQDCFRKYPEIYGSELEDDAEAEAGEGEVAAAAAGTPGEPVQSLEPVVEPVREGEPPVAEFQALREGDRAEGNGTAAPAQKVGEKPWTDNTRANEVKEEGKEASTKDKTN